MNRGTTMLMNELFSRPARRAGDIWVVASVPIAAVTGFFVDGERNYLLAWVGIGAVNLVPALALSILARRRAPRADRRFWLLYAVGVALMLLIGFILIVELAIDRRPVLVLAVPVALGCAVVFLKALFEIVRSRSSIRVNALDVLEAAMVVTAVCAFAPLAWGNRTVDTDSAAFSAVAAIATVGLLAGFCWSLAMFRRIKDQRLPEEILGLALGIVCSLNSAGHVAQGLSGFTLPSAPLLVCQALCFGVVFLLPLHLTDNAPAAYDTLTPLEQTHTRPLDTIAIALLVPMLVWTLLIRSQVGWAISYFVGVTFVLMVLAAVRGKLAVVETRRLYRSVETAADERRRLLGDVLRSADHDRHRVAAQLHQHATGFYVAFTSFLRSTDGDESHPALIAMRDDLEQRSEEMRELMLAVRPLETKDNGSENLESTIRGFVDSLYTDANPPQTDIRIDDTLEMEWTTETIVMRILQEALRNVARHSHAQHLIISIDLADAGVSVQVIDDGVGFDAKHLLFESGNEYMRNFAAHLGGHVFVDSKLGEGTTVRAVLGGIDKTGDRHKGGGDSIPVDRFARRSHLRLVGDAGDAGDLDDASSPTDLGGAGSAGHRASLAHSDRDRESMTDVQGRIAQRRAKSDGRRFFYFKFTPSQTAVKDVLQICAASFVVLPVAILSGFTMDARSDSRQWMFIATALFGIVLLTIAWDLHLLRKNAWNKFDPRIVFGQLSLAMLAAGAFGVATGGQVAIFSPVLLVVLLIGVITASRSMGVGLWIVSQAVVAGVLVITQTAAPVAVWSGLSFCFGSALIAWIVDLTVWKARDGLRSLEAVADFSSFASGVRDWEADSAQVLAKVAGSVAARTVLVFERPARGSRHVREIARWTSAEEMSPFVESNLRLIAERARPDGEFEISDSGAGATRLLAIAAATTSNEIVLAVEVARVGQRDDAALIAAVSSLASVIDRHNLIQDLLGEARTDPLTGLANRRQLREYLEHALGRAARTDESVAVAMIDLDHFKSYNDSWGHAAGDRVLKDFADRLRLRLRAQDVAARYGGEEFCLLLPATSAGEAKAVLDDLRAVFTSVDGEAVTFSAGVAELERGESGEHLVGRADSALYEAKESGRDQVKVAEDSRPRV